MGSEIIKPLFADPNFRTAIKNTVISYGADDCVSGGNQPGHDYIFGERADWQQTFEVIFFVPSVLSSVIIGLYLLIGSTNRTLDS